MNAASPQPTDTPLAFSPQLRVADPLAASWLAEATLRLRREIAWLWHQRAGMHRPFEGALPPAGDPLLESLDLARFADERRRWHESDETARWLGESIASLRAERPVIAGPWLMIAERLALDETAQFALALGLLATADPASGVVIGACQHDAARVLPTLALVQRLFDADAPPPTLHGVHALFRFGLLHTPDAAETMPGWQHGFSVSPLMAHALLHDDGLLPPELRLVSELRLAEPVPATLTHAANALRDSPASMRIVPMLGDPGSDFSDWAARLGALHGRTVLAFRHGALPEPQRWAAIAAWCWLYDADVLLPPYARESEHGDERKLDWPSVPVRWLLPMHDAQSANALPAHAVQPALRLPTTDFATRVRRLTKALGPSAQGLEPAVEEMARRFRLPPLAIDAVGEAAAQMTQDSAFDAEALHALCRAQAKPELGSLAQRVEPRFTLQDMVLPETQRRQLQEIARAMRALTHVHYRWGTARAWNDAGLSVAFCGPPGTGKTMAAEALAHELQLPMFRIDLSQVVNKYIGETEKNLRRVFDAAEESDCVIFFDEADALFGKRTSVKDAHDRFANIEISYLLERMERLKGMAILATNRRKDMDEAFLRRLRYLIEFPLPDEEERERLWRYVFPPGVDTSALDFAALARLFPLAGGHIRSIAFNASLQAADGGAPRISMTPVLWAVKRELDKLNRPNSLESFGAYQDIVQPLFAEYAT